MFQPHIGIKQWRTTRYCCAGGCNNKTTGDAIQLRSSSKADDTMRYRYGERVEPAAMIQGKELVEGNTRADVSGHTQQIA